MGNSTDSQKMAVSSDYMKNLCFSIIKSIKLIKTITAMLDQEVKIRLEEKFSYLGFMKFDVPDDSFEQAYLLRMDMLRPSLAFLVCTHATNENMKLVIGQAKQWVKTYMKSQPFFNEILVNLVCLHTGNLDSLTLFGLPDKTGFNRPMLRSITAINTSNGTMVQESHGSGVLMNATSKLKTTLMALSMIDLKSTL